MGMSQTSPASAGPDSRPPGSGSPAVLPAAPVGMSVPLALMACWASWAPREHAMLMGGGAAQPLPGCETDWSLHSHPPSTLSLC